MRQISIIEEFVIQLHENKASVFYNTSHGVDFVAFPRCSQRISSCCPIFTTHQNISFKLIGFGVDFSAYQVT